MLMARLLQEFHLTLLPGQNEIKHEERLSFRLKGGALCTITRRNKSKDADLKNNSRITDRTQSTDWVRYVKNKLISILVDIFRIIVASHVRQYL